MIPIRDVNPSRRVAFATGLIVVTAAYVFFAIQPPELAEATRFMYEQASIPCEILNGDPLSQSEIQSGRCMPDERQQPVFEDKKILASIVSSIFFHGGLGHLIGNLWILWIFGNNIEEAMGRVRYLLFYLATGVMASMAHVLLNPSSTIPVVGASGAIAGVMGAYLILFPHARVVAIVPPLFFLPFQVPALIFLGLWFFGQFALAGVETNIAWEAHVAGFAVGVLYASVNRNRFRRRVSRVR